jgi:FMN phosphatase YigB (HAD superfamily)
VHVKSTLFQDRRPPARQRWRAHPFGRATNSGAHGIGWDAIVSCEMIGVYKPNAEAYHTAARWLNLPPPL